MGDKGDNGGNEVNRKNRKNKIKRINGTNAFIYWFFLKTLMILIAEKILKSQL
jgi:hypothetical protein